jgi:hypothetical protein
MKARLAALLATELSQTARVCHSCAEPVAKRAGSAGNGMPFLIALALIVSLGLTAYYLTVS